MKKPINIHLGRTNTIVVNLGIDVSSDSFTSEIRAEADQTSLLLATWDIVFETDGVDGRLIMTLDDSQTAPITRSTGYMDIKRVSGGEPISVFNEPLTVSFVKTVTV